MNDTLLAGQVNLAFSYQLQAMCFVIGGLLVFIGLAMAMIIPSGKWNSRGMHLLGTGSLIAVPAVLPMMLFMVGGDSNDMTMLPTWLLPSAYVLFPVVGLCVGIYGWIETGREKVNT